jgi:hypothetical protein
MSHYEYRSQDPRPAGLLVDIGGCHYMAAINANPTRLRTTHGARLY